MRRTLRNKEMTNMTPPPRKLSAEIKMTDLKPFNIMKDILLKIITDERIDKKIRIDYLETLLTNMKDD